MVWGIGKNLKLSPAIKKIIAYIIKSLSRALTYKKYEYFFYFKKAAARRVNESAATKKSFKKEKKKDNKNQGLKMRERNHKKKLSKKGQKVVGTAFVLNSYQKYEKQRRN